MSTEWISYILLVGIGGVLYPQAIQRVYAAKSELSLRRSLAVMGFLPLTTTVVAVIVGIYGLAYHSGLPTEQSDSILAVVLREIQQASITGRVLVLVLFSAILAALMSTADSVLLSISSMFTKDIYLPLMRPSATEAELTRVGKMFSWVVIAAAGATAIALYDRQSLVGLLDKKFDVLVQLSPAFMLGLHLRWLRGRSVLAGLVVGMAIVIWLNFISATPKPFGIHAGLYGLAGNLLTIAVASVVLRVFRRTGE